MTNAPKSPSEIDCPFCQIAAQPDRVAFLFTGGDVAHVHAHVVPMQEKTDITSARYITSPEPVAWGNTHLQLTREELMAVRDQLAFVAEPIP